MNGEETHGEEVHAGLWSQSCMLEAKLMKGIECCTCTGPRHMRGE
jgi:hypothetical protein